MCRIRKQYFTGKYYIPVCSIYSTPLFPSLSICYEYDLCSCPRMIWVVAWRLFLRDFIGRRRSIFQMSWLTVTSPWLYFIPRGIILLLQNIKFHYLRFMRDPFMWRYGHFEYGFCLPVVPVVIRYLSDSVRDMVLLRHSRISEASQRWFMYVVDPRGIARPLYGIFGSSPYTYIFIFSPSLKTLLHR